MKDHMIELLDRGAKLFAAAYAGVSVEEARWRPAEGKWSLLEILGHMLDEERQDFRARIQSTLHDHTAEWAPIDPEGWVVERRHNEKEPAAVLGEFLQERQASLVWLGSLAGVPWELAHSHPKLGPLRAGDLLTAWAVHDQLHLAQVARVRADYAEHVAGKFDGRYARP